MVVPPTPLPFRRKLIFYTAPRPQSVILDRAKKVLKNIELQNVKNVHGQNLSNQETQEKCINFSYDAVSANVLI